MRVICTVAVCRSIRKMQRLLVTVPTRPNEQGGCGDKREVCCLAMHESRRLLLAQWSGERPRLSPD